MLTFHYMINKSYLQINKSEIKITSKLLSKDSSKTPSIEFLIDKPISRMIETNIDEVKVSLKFSMVLTTSNSNRFKQFYEELEKKRTALPSKTVNPLQLIHNHPSINRSEEAKNSQVNRSNDSINEEEKPKEMPKEEVDRITNLRSTIIRKSLNIDYNDFTYNSSCKRCNYMERLIKAQEKDIEVLQNQVECFLRGNFNSPLDKAFELDSENLLKSEPVFKRIFADIDVNLEKAQNNIKRLSQSPNISQTQSPARKSTGDQKNTKRTSSTDGRNNRIIQRPGEEVNIYMLDNDRAKKIEKYEQEIDNLRGQVLSLTKEKKVLEVIRVENEALRVQIAKAEKLRVDLEQKLIDNAYAYQTKIENDMAEIEKLLVDKRYFEESAYNLEVQNQNYQFENTKNSNKIRELEESLKINKINIDVISNNNGTINTLKEEFSKFEKSRIHQQEEFKKSIGELTSRINELKNENNRIMDENNRSNAKIRDLELILQQKVKDLMDKQKRILDLESLNITLKSEHLNVTEIIRHRDELTIKFNRVMEINYNLNEDLAKVNKSYAEKLKVLVEKNDIFEKENANIKDQLDKKRKEVIEKTNQVTGIYIIIIQ